MLKIIFFILISYSVYGDPALEEYDYNNPTVTFVGTDKDLVDQGVVYNLYVDPVANSSSSESSPITVYAPVGNPVTSGTNNYYYSFHNVNSTAASTSNFLNYNSTPEYFGKIQFNFNIKLNGEVQAYNHMAWEDDNGNWNIFTGTSAGGGPTSITADGLFTYNLSFERICGSISNEADFECNTSFINSASDPSAEGELMLFAFMDTAQQSGTITPSNYEGAYYKVKFSNKVNSSGRIYLNDLNKGDTKLYASFDGFDFSDDILQTYIYRIDGSTTEDSNSELRVKDLSLLQSSFTDIDTTNTSGEIAIDDLVNNISYSVRIVYCDKYGYCSHLSNAKAETPEPLEALLKGQACYLLTAGFEGGHPIIDFFRVFRDKILAKHFYGQAFTQLYYNTAPLLTSYIAKRPLLKKIIRVLATILYGVFKFWWVWPTLLITGLILNWKRGAYGRP